MFLFLSTTGGLSFLDQAEGKSSTTNREAMFYKKLDSRTVQCLLCPRECVIGEGRRGFCRNRENQRGKLYTICLLYTSDAADE